MTGNGYHHLLERQIKKAYGEGVQFSAKELALFSLISEYYQHADDDRALIERSLEISSSELSEINEQLRNKIKTAQNRAQEMEKLNKLMIGRELKMIELKKQIAALEKKYAN